MSTTILEPVKVGIGLSIITPPIGVELAGYGFYLHRSSTRVHDNLYSRALVLEGGDKTRIVIISNDLLSLSEKLIEKSKSLISLKVGINKNNILITCTHTHSGPVAAFARGCGRIDPEYLEKLPDKICNSAIEACKNTKPAKLGFGREEVNIISFNRAEKDGPINSSVRVIKIDSLLGIPLAFLFNFACHPVTIDRRTLGSTLISRDWPGYAIDMISSESKVKSMFLQGTCGDINPIVAWHNFQFEGVSITGHIVGSKVIEIARKIKTLKIKKVSLRKRIIQLPLDVFSEEEINLIIETEKQKNSWDNNLSHFYKDWSISMKEKIRTKSYHNMLSVEIALLKIDTENQEVALIFLPGEVFTRLGLKIIKECRFDDTFVIGYYGKQIGYIPDEFDFKRRGYAATVVPRIMDIFPYKKNVGEILVKEALKLFKEE